jgi:antitoxin (DNA-binding transcriptional repressor) of toxin-antitoxin stability system
MEIGIVRANKPVVRLVPVTPPRVQRRLGEAKGLVRMATDFNDLTDDLVEYFR